jgi:hypothetical protein
MPPGAVVRELAKQLLNSGTSIGANLEEADAGQTKADFRGKISISRRKPGRRASGCGCSFMQTRDWGPQPRH